MPDPMRNPEQYPIECRRQHTDPNSITLGLFKYDVLTGVFSYNGWPSTRRLSPQQKIALVTVVRGRGWSVPVDEIYNQLFYYDHVSGPWNPDSNRTLQAQRVRIVMNSLNQWFRKQAHWENPLQADYRQGYRIGRPTDCLNCNQGFIELPPLAYIHLPQHKGRPNTIAQKIKDSYDPSFNTTHGYPHPIPFSASQEDQQTALPLPTHLLPVPAYNMAAYLNPQMPKMKPRGRPPGTRNKPKGILSLPRYNNPEDPHYTSILPATPDDLLEYYLD